MTDIATFDECDVSMWRVIGDEVLGTKPKRWLSPPNSTAETPWLMKDRTFSESARFGRYPKGDDWSERVAAGIAQVMEIPAAQVELASKSTTGHPDLIGVVSKRIHDDAGSLVHGNELLHQYRGTSNAWDMTGYSLQAIKLALEEVGPPPDSVWVTSWQLFVSYLVLDAVIGNTDRHPENWAAIDAGDSANRTLAPSFDHASCLGFQLATQDKQDRLLTNDRNRQPENWASTAKTHFEGKPTTTDAAVEALTTLDQPARRDVLDRIPSFDELAAVIDAVPGHRMGDPSRTFAKRMLVANVDRLTTLSQ